MDQPAPPAPRSDVRPDGTNDPRVLALVVESETVLRIATADLLAEAGFEVLEAWSAPTATRQIELHTGLRLAIIDADLAGPQGRFVLAQEIAARRPDLSLIVLSAGLSPEPGDLPEQARFAQKPLSAALAREVWERIAR